MASLTWPYTSIVETSLEALQRDPSPVPSLLALLPYDAVTALPEAPPFRHRIGVRLGKGASLLNPRGVAAAILDDAASLTELRGIVPTAVRVRTSDEAVLAQQSGASAVVVEARPGAGAASAFTLCQKLKSVLAIPVLVDGAATEHEWAAFDVLGVQGFVHRADGDYRNVVRAHRSSVAAHRTAAWRSGALGPNSDFARAYGLQYPLVQGPMTRVSDDAPFAEAVARAGAMPTIALGTMSGPDVAQVLDRVRHRGAFPWGVGVLGFLDDAALRAQMKAVLEAKPSIAIVAGANLDLAHELETAGTRAFVHTPSAKLFESFARAGLRRFVLEGSECGGHVGPADSLSLWGSIASVLARDEALAAQVEILVAGGIHDALSAAAAATLFGPAALAGARIGFLMGTVYLFTEEAVSCKAITPVFQDVARSCERTALLETGPGHRTRVAATAWVDEFEQERATLEQEQPVAAERTARLESLGLGRLRLAAKGTMRGATGLENVADSVQLERGSFMMGEVATLHSTLTTLAELHHGIVAGGQKLLEAGVVPPAALDIAVIGMECVMPGARSKDEFWANILADRVCIEDVPLERWDAAAYYDPEGGPWKTPSRWGGFIPGLDFDPVEYGIVPRSVASIDPAQLVALHVVSGALRDSGLQLTRAERERVAVVFGVDGGGELAAAYGACAARSPAMPAPGAPAWSEDVFPGVLGNVVAGRVANRFDFGGANYAVDAACASGLSAVKAACSELTSGKADVAIAGAVDLHNGLSDYMMFASVRALSRTGRCRAFDAQADGIVLGEGAAALVLRRLDDAVRDGDRIYGVIRSLGAGSDGRAKSLTAPSRQGQLRCLRDAYTDERWARALGLVEAHGTGTVVGDETELDALQDFFARRGESSITLGSVKTQIGHTKCAAGLAGLMKALLAVHHGVLPPQHGPEVPIEAYRRSARFRIRRDVAPWTNPTRIAGVSAFGFGGTNFHAVVEDAGSAAHQTSWPCELFLIRGESRSAAWDKARELALRARECPGSLSSLAWAASKDDGAPVQYAFVASSIEHATTHLRAVQGLGVSTAEVFVAQKPEEGAVAILYPGQGSQRPGMWKELLTYWPAWRDFAPDVGDLCGAMFPGLGTSTEDAATRLRDTRLAQQALGLTALAASTLLDALGIAGSFFAGHSYGELPALAHAGVIARSDLIAVSLARGEAILNAQGDGPFAMLAASLGAEEGEALVRGSDDVWVANINAPREIVLSGSRSGIERLRTALENRDVEHRELNVACAFHTPLMVPAAERFSEHLKGVEFHGGHGVVFGSDARAYTDGDDVRARLTNQITRPVHFARTVDAMYDAGARIFVDVGPGRVLSGLIGQVLAERPHQVVSLDSQGGTLRGFLAGIAQLACLGVAVELGPLLRARGADRGTGVANPARKPWSLNGGGCRPPSDEATTEPAAQRTVEPGSITGDEVDVKNDRSIHGDSADALVSAYLDNMRALASEQHALLLHYLQGPESQRTEPVRRLPTRENALPARPAAPPAAPARPAEVALPVSGTSQLARREAAPAIPVAPRPPSGGDYEQAVRAIVARETGYPEEILGMNTDLEAELGVDSLKRLEITVQAAEWAGVDAGARGTAQQAARGFTTMAAIVDWLKKKSNGAAHP